jgi:predicted porin
MYGKVDLGVRKAIGASAKEIGTGSDGRFGVRGTESLGGGLNAFFNIEHRFFPDTGALDGPAMWKGLSHVGLSGPWGRVGLGRQYTAAFSLIQNQIDPFGGDTVAALRDVSMRVGGITRVRIDGSLRYDVTFSGLTLAASVAESDKNIGPDRPVSLAGIYRSGPLFVAAGMEDPAGVRDKQWNIGGGYRVGSTLLTAGYSSGTMNTGVKAKGWMLAVDHKMGAGSLKAAYGTQERGGVRTAQKLGLGYHHSLSKRTTIYADVAQDSKATRAKSGYDLGIIHTF